MAHKKAEYKFPLSLLKVFSPFSLKVTPFHRELLGSNDCRVLFTVVGSLPLCFFSSLFLMCFSVVCSLCGGGEASKSPSWCRSEAS